MPAVPGRAATHLKHHLAELGAVLAGRKTCQLFENAVQIIIGGKAAFFSDQGDRVIGL